MKKLKLLYLDFYLPYLLKDIDYPVGGAAVEWISWIEGFKSNKNEIGVLTWKGAKKYINREIDFDIIETYELNKGIPKLRLFYYHLPSLYKAARDYNPDFIVQESAGIETGLMASVARLLRKPFIYRVASDADVDYRIKSMLTKMELMAYEFGLKNSDFVSCQNSYQMEKLKNKYPNKKMFVLYNPFMIDRSINVSNDRSNAYIAWVGVFKKTKNLPVLYEIVKQLPEVQFKIAGKTNKENIHKETIEAVNALKRCKNVEFVGYLKRSEIISFLNQAYALLNTSFYEGFSNTFLESWATGTPVITTSNVNPDSLINKHKLGLVAESYSDIPSLIKNLIHSPGYEKLSIRCRNYVENNHDPGLLASKFIEKLHYSFNQ